ncbi:hypothetical protein VB734_13575 [Synechococcus sp. BA-124 BA4]|uniref:hypothetical protein n=1 Tax=Synechococcus sp. BA-124 BA4 TaxID=3110251 RepID=UPI002B21AA2C|nr:hypothetical protein [Synechococcus sp. BA-124 BA4]MEA5401069.1 hypothetical protein [Synechococcus sp. BA-124 BA4]MEA5411896.1 hypothetical protein [Synechococcus sp. BA-120 BA3]
MDDTDPSPLAETHWARHLVPAALTGLLILFCLSLAGQGLTTAYSYWSDELWSVAASSSDWGVLFRDWLIPDVHPPLYQILLKLWIGSFGTGEPATRSLSFLIAALGLVVAALCSSGRGAGRRLFTVAFLGTSPAFLFYAQETRSYALSLTLSTLMLGTALLLRQRTGRHETALRWGFTISCLLLSLTHYFSLIFVLVVLAVVTAEGTVFRSRTAAIPLLLLLLLWPLLHGLLSPPTENLTRIDWIAVRPVSGTITQFMAGTLPLLDPRQGLRGLLILLALVGGIGAATFPLFTRGASSPRPPATGEARFLLTVITAFLAVILAIDPFRPLSQSRYYIVVLPALAYLVGTGWELTVSLGRVRRVALASLLCAALLLQLRIGTEHLAIKQGPLENYKLLASFLAKSDLCRKGEGCWSSGWFPEALRGTYFSSRELMAFDPGTPLAQTRLDRPLLGFRRAYPKLKGLIANNPALACWEAPGSWKTTSFILLPRTSPAQPARHGMRPCP